MLSIGLLPVVALVAPPPLYLGIDLSTQSVTGVLLDSKLKPAAKIASVNFDESFPEYKTAAGMNVMEDGVVTSPVRLWLRALDTLFTELQATGLLKSVAAISCSGQQHGTVYWTAKGLRTLESQSSAPSGFAEALPDDCFSVLDSPIWADSSTSAECRAIEAAIADGAVGVASLTGSRAYERFSGVQMMAIASRYPKAWESTSKVSLVSSFCASLLTGSFVPIDYSDASGTLLMGLKERQWAPEMLQSKPFASLDLGAKLGGEPVPSHQIVGQVSALLTERWGFDSECAVAASSGDNPCALAGLGLSRPGDLALSLGTSDTLLGVAPASSATPATEGHVMAHPTDPESVMAMLCYKNGGAARQEVRDTRCSDKDWKSFDAALRAGTPGNDGILGLHLPLAEITPIIPRAGVWHVDASDNTVASSSLTEAQAIRAVVEGRFLSMRARGGAIGLRDAKRVLATGGGSQSSELLQVASDVFNAPILLDDTPDAAAVGAARRAAHAHALMRDHGGDVAKLPYAAFLDAAASGEEGGGLETVAMPRADAAAVYSEALVERYRQFEDRVASAQE